MLASLIFQKLMEKFERILTKFLSEIKHVFQVQPDQKRLDNLGDTIAVKTQEVLCGHCFSTFFEKCVICEFRCPLASGITVCSCPGDQVGAPGSNSLTERRSGGSKMAVKGEVRAKLKRSGRGALWELWRLLANRRSAGQTQVKPELQVYLAVHSYD